MKCSVFFLGQRVTQHGSVRAFRTSKGTLNPPPRPLLALLTPPPSGGSRS